jgi:hypothetical protein
MSRRSSSDIASVILRVRLKSLSGKGSEPAAERAVSECLTLPLIIEATEAVLPRGNRFNQAPERLRDCWLLAVPQTAPHAACLAAFF